jgi:hypothetical protein
VQYVGKADGAGTIRQRWATYSTNGHGGNVELRNLDPKPDEIKLAVLSLIRQAQLSATVESIVCAGGKSYASVTRRLVLIEQEVRIPAESVKRIPHYFRANAKIYGHDPKQYRSLVHAAISLV